MNVVGDGPPPSFERRLQLAQQQLQVGQLAGAVESLRGALAEDPDHADVHALLALTLHDMKRLHAAAHEAEVALSLDPLGRLPLTASGVVLLARRRLGAAEERFEQLRRLWPEDPEPPRLLARLRKLQNKRREQKQLLDESLARDPEDVDTLADLADWHLEQGDLETAERYVREALEIEPEDPDALISMGHLLLRRGDVEAAREHAVWALRKDPSDRAALHLLTAVKARKNPLLGLWWRYSTWMGALGEGRAIVVLLVAYVLYRFAVITAESVLEQPGVAALVSLGWLGIVAYTWFGPAIFYRSLKKELAGVELKDF